MSTNEGRRAPAPLIFWADPEPVDEADLPQLGLWSGQVEIPLTVGLAVSDLNNPIGRPRYRECGTLAAARRHERWREPYCPECAEAVRALWREKARRRYARKKAESGSSADTANPRRDTTT